ncbi:sporulation protein [Streptomyces sp. NPDC096153]|uniref:sporulation protein n=1 Tax=Streptomyces sp. NPDC096153 TaxID=3155548 RepID=UPI003332F29E
MERIRCTQALAGRAEPRSHVTSHHRAVPWGARPCTHTSCRHVAHVGVNATTVFKKLLGPLAAGGPTVDTSRHAGPALPGGSITGQVHLDGGNTDFDIQYITLELAARAGQRRTVVRGKSPPSSNGSPSPADSASPRASPPEGAGCLLSGDRSLCRRSRQGRDHARVRRAAIDLILYPRRVHRARCRTQHRENLRFRPHASPLAPHAHQRRMKRSPSGRSK